MILIVVFSALIGCTGGLKSLQNSAVHSHHSGLQHTGRYKGHHVQRSCETYCPDPDLPRPDSLTDPACIKFPPLIHHIKSERDFPNLPALIAHETSLPLKYIRELVAFGAVYLSVPIGSTKAVSSNLHTKGSKSVSIRQANMQEKRTNLEHRDSLNLMTRVGRVIESATFVPSGSYCRVHVNPQRYREAVFGLTWRDRIIRDGEMHEAKDSKIIFVDKVAGVPVSATVDNNCENMLYQVQSLLPKSDPPLHLASRLDVCTSGIVPLATDEVTAAVLSKAIAERKIEKVYLALCRKKIPLGTVQHCFRRKSKSHENAKPTLLRAYDATLLEQKSSLEVQPAQPQANALRANNLQIAKKKFGIKKRMELSATVTKENDNSDTSNLNGRERKGSSRSGNQPGSVWQLAELEVLSCTALAARDISQEAREHLHGHTTASSNDGSSGSSRSGDGGATGLYECEIRLITGRTHQIRLQLAALGASIIGDTRYNPVEGLLDCSRDDEGVVVSADVPRWRGVREGSQLGEMGSTDSRPLSAAARAVGDGEHLMGPEPKRIGLQCSRLRFPAEVTRLLQLERPVVGQSSRVEEREDLAGSSRGTITFPAEEDGTSGGLLVTAGIPWWRSSGP